MRLARGLLVALFWLSLLEFPYTSAADELDASWVRCLGHFLTHRYQCGHDYIWTYGPLGYFIHGVYLPDLFWCKYAWELAVKFAFAWMLLCWMDRLPNKITRVLFVGVVFLYLAGAMDSPYLFGIILLGLLPLCDETCRKPAILAAGTLLLAALALTKFTFFLLCVAAWLVVILAPVLDRRRRIAVAVGFPALVVLLWVALGQSFVNIPAFLSSSWELARGYGEAMAEAGVPQTTYLGLAGLVGFLAVPLLYSATSLRRREYWLGLALVTLSLALVWKHGFIRERTHYFHFFNYLLLVPFAVEGLLGRAASQPPRQVGLRIGWILGLIVLSTFGLYGFPSVKAQFWRLYTNGSELVWPHRLQQLLDEARDTQRAELALPEMSRLVDGQTVDQISTAQGVVLLNGWNYRPRPVFQSYAAYTPGLLARNAAFYQGEQAPAFVLWQLEPIDHRLPTLEDGPALLEIFRRYRPVRREKGFILLKRRPDVQEVERSIALERMVSFDEEVRLDTLGSQPKSVALHIEDTPRGWLTKTLFRAPPLSLELRLSNGATHSYRLIPAMAGSAFLLDPLIRDDADVLTLYAGHPLPRVESFWIRAKPEARACYRDHVSVVVREERRFYD